jgi:hypothetical protein
LHVSQQASCDCRSHAANPLAVVQLLLGPEMVLVSAVGLVAALQPVSCHHRQTWDFCDPTPPKWVE